MPDLLIENGTVRTSQGWIDNGYIWIQAGKIAAIGAGKPPPEASAGTSEIVNASHCAVLPGLTNAHTHLSQSFMRGLAGGRSLVDWLKQVIWPLQAVISPEELYLASLLGLVENLRCGVTNLIDHHKITKTQAHTEAVLKAAQEVGLRFTLARAWSDVGEKSETPQGIIDDLSRLYASVQDYKLITVANGPLALWRCSAESLITTHELALSNQSFTHFHVSESQQEVDMSLDVYGLRPAFWLDSIGVLDPNTQVVHAVWLNDKEIELVKAQGASVIHCPVSNSVLGSGVAPISRILEVGVKVQLGTDGAASNDTQDIWESLKFAVCLARAVEQDSQILPSSEALQLVIGDRSPAVGESADLIIVNLNHPRLVPVADPDSTLVLSTHGCDVQTVIVAGEFLLKDGQVTIMDEDALLDECVQVANSLRRKIGI